MKKICWSTLSDTEVEKSGNHIVIKGEPEKDLEVSIVNKKGDEKTEITRYKDLKGDQHTVLITPKLEWKSKNDYEETDSANIEFFIKRADDCWKVNKEKEKLEVEPNKQDKFEEAKKEMHKKLLEEKFDKWIDDKNDVKGQTDMKYKILNDGGGGFKVKIYLGDTSDDREFTWEKVEIEPNYWQTKVVDFDNAIRVVYKKEETKKFHWTPGRIIFFVVLATAVILIAIFWKKIWKWIKGEREQEKKVKEQLDIF